MANFRILFDSLNAEQKSDFLLKALNNSDSLQNQLVQYFGGSHPPQADRSKSYAARVKEAFARVQKKLKTIDLEDLDYTSYVPSGRYYDHWEVANELAEIEVQKIMSQLSANCIQLITEGEFEAFMAEFTACLAGVLSMEIHDPNEILGDPQDLLHQSFNQLTRDCSAQLKTVILNTASLSHTIFLAVRWFQNENNSNASAGYHDDLCCDLIRQHGYQPSGEDDPFVNQLKLRSLFPKTYLAMLRHSDPRAWISESEQLAVFSSDIGGELLDYLFVNDPASFYRIAAVFFDYYPNDLVNILATRIDPARDRNFAIRVWEYKVVHQKTMDDYKALSKLLDDSVRKENLLETLEKSSDYKFYVKVLAYEKMYERILAMARKGNHFFYNYETLLAPIAKVYPGECFQLAVREVESEMNSAKLSRSNYERIASLLKVLDKNPALKPEVRIYVRKLMATNSRRSALREELVKAGLF